MLNEEKKHTCTSVVSRVSQHLNFLPFKLFLLQAREISPTRLSLKKCKINPEMQTQFKHKPIGLDHFYLVFIDEDLIGIIKFCFYLLTMLFYFQGPIFVEVLYSPAQFPVENEITTGHDR